MTTTAPIDCDLHPTVPNLTALYPYLDEMWREQAIRRGFDEMNTIAYPANTPLSVRADWRDAQGRPATTPERLAAEALAPFGTGTAILNCLYGTSVAFSDDIQAAFCKALNDWIAHQWLDRDARLRASIVVPLTNTDLAVAEIERRAADPRFVQVLLPVSGEIPLGRRQNWPIYRAAERHDLPIGIHAGSSFLHPPSATGWPSYYLEDYVSQAPGFAGTLNSLVTEGVFLKFPRLKVVLIESGVTWLPAYLWRINKTWRGVRAETPWLDRPPSEIIREHVRLTIQPFDDPDDQSQLQTIIEEIGCDKMLLFSTDYPHWHFEGTDAVPDGLPDDLVRKILVDNPLETYSRLS